jgi:hypothetical protein
MSKAPIFDQMILAAHMGGARKFARWERGGFEVVVRQVMRPLWGEWVEKRGRSPSVMQGYLSLFIEGFGRGYLGERVDYGVYWEWKREPRKCPGVLAYGLMFGLPKWLLAEGVGEEKAAALMAEIWNVGEGLRGMPWLDRCGVSVLCREGGGGWEGFKRGLVGLLGGTEGVRWRGPWGVHCLDLGEWDRRFLPGELFVAGHRLLGVVDVEERGRCLGVLLEEGTGRGEVVGWLERKVYQQVKAVQVKAVWGEREVMVGGEGVALGAFGELRHGVVHPFGVLAAIAKDSQRLWLVGARG